MKNDRFVDVIIVGVILTAIILKLTRVITIDWIWVLSPIWIMLSLGLIFGLLFILWVVIYNFIDKLKEKRNERY